MTTSVELNAKILEVDPLSALAPISLSELENQAELMEREDLKYVINEDRILATLAESINQLQILEINGERSFHYENCYFDSDENVCDHDHRRGKRKRFKVRTRYYKNSDTCFLEIKLKGSRDRTIKSRIPYDPSRRDQLDTQAVVRPGIVGDLIS